MRYKYNPYCPCSRCRAHGYMGPAVLITLGVLFLLSQVSFNYWLSFHNTWPALLIVIGLVMFLQHSAPANGHIPREYGQTPPAYPVRPVQPGAVVTPPPVQPGGSLQPAPYNQASPYNQGGEHPEDKGVHNG